VRVGELAVSIAQGPHAILAAVVRGSIQPAVRASFETALESVHRQFGSALQTFSGDSSCVRAGARCSKRAWSVNGAAKSNARRIGGDRSRDRRGRSWEFGSTPTCGRVKRWNAYLDRVAAEPGIVVLASGKRDGAYFVTGLRDPLSRPRRLLSPRRTSHLRRSGRWEPYQALDPPFVTARAALLLRPPPGVSLTYDQGLLTATGAAPQQWIDDSAGWRRRLQGVRRVHVRRPERRSTGHQWDRARPNCICQGQSSIDPPQQPALDA
jgi:OOP family OmpA-OmpF porin